MEQKQRSLSTNALQVFSSGAFSKKQEKKRRKQYMGAELERTFLQ